MSTPGAPAIRVDVARSGTVAVSPGMVGPQGGGVRLDGAVASYADLPTGLGVEDAGASFATQDDGLLYVWSGTAWPPAGAGSQFRGDKGDRGTGVESVSVAGDDLSFGLSDGTSRRVTVPALVAASSAAAEAVGAADRAVSARDGAKLACDGAVAAASSAEGAAAGVAADAVAAGDAAGRAEVAADAADSSAAAADSSAAAAGVSAAEAGEAREFVSGVHEDFLPGGDTRTLLDWITISAADHAANARDYRDAAAASATAAAADADRAESAAASGGGIIVVSSEEEAAALPIGTVYVIAAEVTPGEPGTPEPAPVTIVGTTGENITTDAFTPTIPNATTGDTIIIAANTKAVGGSTLTTPVGFTTLLDAYWAGTQRSWVLAGPWSDGLTITADQTLEFGYAAVAVRGAASVTAGTVKDRVAEPAESTTVTAPMVEHGPNDLAIGIAFERTSATETAEQVTVNDGWAIEHYTAQGENFQTTLIGVGGTGDMVVTYPNPQTTNGLGVQVVAHA